MTRTYGVSDFMAQAQRLEGQLLAAIAEFNRRTELHDQRVAAVVQGRAEALGQLTAVLLPDFTTPTLQRAGRATGFARLLPVGETTGRLEAERQQLTARLAELDADPRYQQRELLRAPRVGTLSREVDELEDFKKPFVELLAAAAHPLLDELLAVGYGTDKYAVPWWRLSYYGHWKAGDEVLARFPGKASFADLRGELVTAKETVAVYETRLAELRGQIADGEAIERAHDDTAARLRDLETIYLTEWRALLARHLADADLVEVARNLADDEAASMLLKAFAGIDKKLVYLDRLHQEQVVAPRGALENELWKLRQDRMKLSRPKKAGTTFDGVKFEKRFADRGPRLQKQWARHDHASTTIYSFHDYDRGSLVADFLWWDLMTDGQIDGNFIPEVREFHQHHPDYVWRDHDRDADAADAAASAVLATDASSAGDGANSLVSDPS